VLTLLWARRRLPTSATHDTTHGHTHRTADPRPRMSEAFAFSSPCSRLAPNPRCSPSCRLRGGSTCLRTPNSIGEDEPREPRKTFAFCGQRGPRIPERRARSVYERAPCLECPSSTRVAASLLREGWRLPHSARTRPEVPFRRRPAKSDGFGKTEVLSSVLEPVGRRSRDDTTTWGAPRDCSRARRPGSAQCHAAPHVSVIVGHCSRGSRLLLRRFGASP